MKTRHWIMLSTFRPLKMRPLRCLETSASSYPVVRRHMPEERKPHMSKCYIKPGRPKTRTPGTVTVVKRYALCNVGSWEKLILVTKAAPVPKTTGYRTNISSACNNRLFEKTTETVEWAELVQSVQRLATGRTVRGSNPGGGRFFSHPSKPSLGPTQPPIQWVPGIYRG